MLLKCLIDHTHQDQHYKAGDVYEVEDFLGSRLLRDFGGNASSEDAKRGNTPKFEATTEEATPPEGEAPEGETRGGRTRDEKPEEEEDDKASSAGRRGK